MDFRSILVPISANVESERAMDAACRLASDNSTRIVAVAVVEVPPVLPLDAHMRPEEEQAHELLERARAIADSYGVNVTTRTLRARDVARALVDEADRRAVDILIVGAPRKNRAVVGSTVEHVLKNAPCRVMLISAPAAA